MVLQLSIAPEFEGHGKATRRNRPFRAQYFVENVLDYMEQHSLHCVDIFGYSMGGYVGVCMAQMHPERVNRVFTFATKFNWTPAFSKQEASQLNPNLIRKKAPRFAKALESRHGDDWMSVVKKTNEMTLFQPQEKITGDENLKRIKHRIRLSLGDRDKMVSLEETNRIYGLLPNGELQVFPGTPHFIEQTSEKMLAKAIMNFFKNQTDQNNLPKQI